MATSFTSEISDRNEIVVFCCGLGCDRTYWKTAFSGRHTPGLAAYDKYSFDWPGHGDLATSRAPANIEHFAAELSADFDIWAGEYDRIHVISHSMGTAAALIAWDQTVRGSDAEGFFVSIEGNLTGDDCGLISRDLATGTATVDDALAELRESHSAEARAWAAMLEYCNPAAITTAARSLVDWCDSGMLPDRWRRLASPVYMVGAESDPPTWHESLFIETGTRVITIPGAGHFPMFSAPSTLWLDPALWIDVPLLTRDHDADDLHQP
jgi:pimeloyl-ACP methyl ester carboxylesterase